MTLESQALTKMTEVAEVAEMAEMAAAHFQHAAAGSAVRPWRPRSRQPVGQEVQIPAAGFFLDHQEAASVTREAVVRD